MTAEIAYVPAAYSKSIGKLFHRNQMQTDLAELKGRIAISEGFAFPQKIREFELAGAVGVIAINPGIDVHWGISARRSGARPTSRICRASRHPVLAVNNPDGQELIKLAGTKKTATIRTRLEEGWVQAEGAVVEIKGSEEPEKFVLLHGHYDSWDVGVGDNATGDATMLEIAASLPSMRDGCAAPCASPGGRDTPPAATPARPGSPTVSLATSMRIAWPRSIATAPAAAGRPSSRTSPGRGRRRITPSR